MNVYIGENVKRLRAEKGLTQEELADFLGVTFQAVSKWERNVAYPDVEMIPVIANYFEVSIDELMGNEKIRNEEKIKEYLAEYDRLYYGQYTDNWREACEKKNALAKQAYKEFPNDWRIIHMLCCSFTDGYVDQAEYDSNEPQLKKLIKFTLDKCTIDEYRTNAILTMVGFAGGDIEEEQKWLNKIYDPMEVTRNYEAFYLCLRNKRYDEAQVLVQKLVKRYASGFIYYISDLSYMLDDEHCPDAEGRIKWMKKSLEILNIIYSAEDSDAILKETATLYEHMARTYWGALGDIENGYICFEKSVDLWEKYYQLPFDSEKEYKTDIFSRLTWKKNARSNLAEGLIDFDYPERYLKSIQDYHTYDSFRNDERFINCVKRIEKYCEK